MGQGEAGIDKAAIKGRIQQLKLKRKEALDGKDAAAHSVFGMV